METLTPAMKEAIAALGELIKADPRNAAIQEAIAEYERSEELNGLIAEYNTQQNVLSDLYGKTHGSDSDESAVEMRDAIQDRIDQMLSGAVKLANFTVYDDSFQTLIERRISQIMAHDHFTPRFFCVFRYFFTFFIHGRNGFF